jgi:hypothetical protein
MRRRKARNPLDDLGLWVLWKRMVFSPLQNRVQKKTA